MLLGQFLYTSFANVGFQLFSSRGMSDRIQQDLLVNIIQRYWDDYNPPPLHYRAVYLQQTSLQNCLFGWLYNNGKDDLNRQHTPYFVGHYLPISLNSVLLELIFAFLTKGPAFNLPPNLDIHPKTSLQEQNLPDLWSYQPLRPGLMVSDTERRKCHEAIREGQPASMFTAISEQHRTIAELNETVCEALINVLTRHLGPIARVIVWQALEESMPIIDPYQRAQWLIGKLSSELLDGSAKPALRQQLEIILYGYNINPQPQQKTAQANAFDWVKLISPDNTTSYGSI